MAWVRELQLNNFRCYDQAALTGLHAGAVVLYGPNGAGKTNILEAVSFFVPGRGLRSAKIQDVQKRDAHDVPWSVSANIETAYGPTRIGTGRDEFKDKRIVRINGEAARGQNMLAEYLSCVWLTPQMDRLFLDAAGSRRRFLDRLVFAFDPSHSGRVLRYENALRQRSKLLQGEAKEGKYADPAWLQGLEETIAETGVAIAAARQEFVVRLQQACDKGAADGNMFPRARLSAMGTIEELLTHAPALEVEDMFKYQLRESRAKDAVTGGAATGPHKGDLGVIYADKDMPADQCSTGEQKALLIGIILAHAHLIKAERGAPPLLLLDEVAAHLDDGRRAALYDLLLAIGSQIWLTGTDFSLFEHIQDKARIYELSKSEGDRFTLHDKKEAA